MASFDALTDPAERDLEIARMHFARMWPNRHNPNIHVFANGTVLDRAARVASLKDNLRAQRSSKEKMV